MRKKFRFNIVNLLILIICIYPTDINATRGTYECTDCNYEKTIDIIQETMKSYYFKGPKIQYNFAKVEYGINSPEDATEQDIKYLVCAGYTYGNLVEAFGMKRSSESTTPRYNSEIILEASNYYNENKNDNTKLDGNYLIYYENTSTNETAKYIYNASEKLEDFVNLIQPGDLFVFTGHALMAYDVVDRDNDGTNDDVLILHSIMTHHIPSKIDPEGTFRLSFNILRHNLSSTNGLINEFDEGTITWEWLSNVEEMVSEDNNGDEIIKCSAKECAVLRTFYENENENDNDNDNSTIFNYQIDTLQYKNSKLRTSYPGLQIEKTSTVGDNNSINLGDEITYTIKVTNNTNLDGQNKNYRSFYIKEIIDENIVTFKSASDEYTSTDDGGKKIIQWKIICDSDTNEGCLAPGESVSLEYTVEVNDDIDNIGLSVNAEGQIFNTISKDETYLYVLSTGMVENKIVPKTISSKNNTYEKCYNQKKVSSSGIGLINDIYECVYGDNYSKRLSLLSKSDNFTFEEFSFEDIFDIVKDNIKDKSTSNLLKIKKLTDKSKIFYDMILNNYWNALTVFDNKILLPRWSGTTAELRARTIVSEHFKDGDVLIYRMNADDGYENHTNENGLYAYIYIGNKFVGINTPLDNSNYSRNEFTYQYYTTDKISAENVGYESSGVVSENHDLLTMLKNDFYTRINTVNRSYIVNNNKSKLNDIYEFINYQTLFGKDYYVILRPELLLDNLYFDNSLKVYNKYKYISGVNLNTKVSEMLEKIHTIGTVSITNNENLSVTNNDVIGTGSKVIVELNASTYEYTTVVLGDVNGDGLLKLSDIMKAANYIYNDQSSLDGEYLEAADYDNSNSYDLNDIMKMAYKLYKEE